MQHGLKNAEAQTGSGQTITASREHDAFGNVLSSSGTWNGPFGYAGGFGYQEDASGLKLLGHRYYDSSIGRFLTRDPIKDGRNWYVYCDSKSIVRIDTNGLGWWFHGGDVSNLSSEDIYIVGEPGAGKGWEKRIIRPGERDPDMFDADYIYHRGRWSKIEYQSFLYVPTGSGSVTISPDGDLVVNSGGVMGVPKSEKPWEAPISGYGSSIGKPRPEKPPIWIDYVRGAASRTEPWWNLGMQGLRHLPDIIVGPFL